VKKGGSLAAVAILLLTSCTSGTMHARGTLVHYGVTTQADGCTTFHTTAESRLSIGGGPRLGRYVPFTPVLGPFATTGSHWALVPVSQRKPLTVEATLGRDLGMAVDAAHIFVQPNSYRGADNFTGGAVWHVTMHNLRPEGQTIRATFAGLDDSGKPLPRGVYRLLVNLDGHRTSSSTCSVSGPVDPAFQGQTETGFNYGLISIGGAPRPRGL
jgi:hypothetical protein